MAWPVQLIICEKDQNRAAKLKKWWRFILDQYSNQFLIIYKKPCAKTQNQRINNVEAQTEAYERVCKVILLGKKKSNNTFSNWANCSLLEKMKVCKAKTKREEMIGNKFLENFTVFYPQSVLVLELGEN